MDVHIFGLYFDPHVPEIGHDILLFPQFPFRSMGPDYSNKEIMVLCKISFHVAWLRIAISSAS